MKVIIFYLGNQEYALDVNLLSEIIAVPAITRLPNVPDFIEGTIKRGDRVIPLINLSKRLSVPEGGGIGKCIFLVKYEDRIVGLIVDAAVEILDIPGDIWEVEGNQPGKSAPLNSYISGTAYLGTRFLIRLDIDQIMTLNMPLAAPLREAI